MPNSMILTLERIREFPNALGAKTKHLEALSIAGYRVPPFVAIPAFALRGILSDDGSAAREIAGEVRASLAVQSYAVRSSALVEDGLENSFAGQFSTKIDVSPEELASAILSVCEQAHSYLDGSLERFSLLVQEYVPADYSGVCFTRNPTGGREMIIEYHAGIGEDLVSGKIRPEHRSLYWNQALPDIELPDFENAFRAFQSIERQFGYPQDIEWCIRDGQWYMLQSRPVTTVSAESYGISLRLDEALPKGDHFFWEKTGISEIMARPVPYSLSLLEKIYAKNGPVDRTYARFGIRFEPGNFLKIVGNELYVDRQAEIKTLLPAYGYFAKSGKERSFQPRWSEFAGSLRTVHNMW